MNQDLIKSAPLTVFQEQAMIAALNKMLNGRTFYVTDLDTIATIKGVQIGGKDYQALRGLHCMSWGEMSPELREMTQRKILEVLDIPTSTLAEVVTEKDITPDRPKLRLFGRSP